MEKLLTVKTLAILLGRTEGAIRNDLSRKPQQLPPPIRIGGLVRWRKSDISNWLDLLAKRQHNCVVERPKRKRGRPTKAEQLERNKGV